jgi:hypothetical protein
MNKENIPTRRTLIIRKPDLNKFELYKKDPRFIINKVAEEGAFKQFMGHNPLPYYMGDPHTLEGGSFWSDFADGFKKGFTTTLDIGSKLLPLVGLGHQAKGTFGDMEGCGKKKRAPRRKKIIKEELSSSEEEEMEHEQIENTRLKKIENVVKDMKKENKKMIRGQLVKKLMAEKGMTLGQASKHIKEHKLI